MVEKKFGGNFITKMRMWLVIRVIEKSSINANGET